MALLPNENPLVEGCCVALLPNENPLVEGCVVFVVLPPNENPPPPDCWAPLPPPKVKDMFITSPVLFWAS